jgi:hypothetical protein
LRNARISGGMARRLQPSPPALMPRCPTPWEYANRSKDLDPLGIGTNGRIYPKNVLD